MAKIAFLATASLESPYSGGRCLPWAKYLHRQGHQVHIVTLHHHWTSDVPRHFRHEGVHIHQIGQMHVRKLGDVTQYFSFSRLLWTVARSFGAMTRTVLALRPHIIHIGKPHPQNTLAGLIAGSVLRGSKVFLDYDDYESGINRFNTSFERWVIRLFENRSPRYVHGVTTHTTFLHRRLLQNGVPETRLLRLPSGFDPEWGRATGPIPSTSWRGYGFPRWADGDLPVLYVGTIAFTSHALEILFEAIPRVLSREKRAFFVFVGGGADLEQAREQVRAMGIDSRVCFMGRVPHGQVPRILRDALVSVDPVRDTPVDRARWPLKIVESLGMGVPVVTGDVGDRREILQGDTGGTLVRPGDPQALAAGILETLERRRAVPGWAQVIQDSAVSRFHAGILAERLAAFYLR